MEKRRAERVDRRLPVFICDIEFSTTNLSLSGMQFTIPAASHPEISAELETGLLTVQIRITDDDHVSADGRVAYVAEADGEYLVGVEFTSFHADDVAAWEAFLSQYIGG